MSSTTTKQVSTSTLIMGPSATGKSALIATLAEYVWETFRKETYYYLTDGGGFPTKLQALVDLGIVRLWRVRTRSASGLTFETLQRACQGWWPVRIKAPTGEVEPAVKLVPPMQVVFVVTCPQGHVVKKQAGTAPSPITMMCPTCKAPIQASQQKVEKQTIFTKGFENRGAVCFDGLTSMSPMMLNDLAARAGRMELQGEKSGLGGVVGSGELIWAGNNRAQVGFAQSRLEELVNASLGIPGLVIPPVFTALTAEALEGGLRVKGPQLAGQAKTADAPQWFGNVLETTLVKDGDGHDCHALLLESFVDADGVKHPLRTRAKPGILPKMLVDPSIEEIRKDPAKAFTQFHLGVFFKMLDEALEKEKAEQRARFQDAPGTAEEMVYGEEDQPGAGTVGTAGTGSPASAPVAGAPRPIAAPVAGGGLKSAPSLIAAPAPTRAPQPPPVSPASTAPTQGPAQAGTSAAAAVSQSPTVSAAPAPVAPSTLPPSLSPPPAGARPLAPPAGAPRVAKAPPIPGRTGAPAPK